MRTFGPIGMPFRITDHVQTLYVSIIISENYIDKLYYVNITVTPHDENILQCHCL